MPDSANKLMCTLLSNGNALPPANGPDPINKSQWFFKSLGTSNSHHDLFGTAEWFTGLIPKWNVCPGVNPSGVIASLSLPNLASGSRSDMLDYFNNSWTLHETLFAGLRNKEAFFRRPDHKLRHPLIFYYGHPAAFYVNKFRVAGLIDKPINPSLESILESGVDENSWDDLSQDEHDWPTLEVVHAYRAQVYKLVCGVLESTDFAAESGNTTNPEDPTWAIVMAFEHDRIHLDTSSVLIRETPGSFVTRHPAWPAPTTTARTSMEDRLLPKNDMVHVPEGKVQFGKPWDFPSFSWDNEYGHEKLQVPAFHASRYLVTNGQFYDFVVDGGYRQQKYWSADGWGQIRLHNQKWPRFWVLDGPAGLHSYRLRTVFDVVPMAWDWPICVNYHEAKAYCSWLGQREETSYRLITEAEHHRMRQPVPDQASPQHDLVMCCNGHELASKGINLNLSYGSETPVDYSPSSDTGFGDVMGNVWQWCEDSFSPLSGFTPHPYYEDFSTPFFGGKHHLLLGGAFISTGDEASIWVGSLFAHIFSSTPVFDCPEPGNITLARGVHQDSARETRLEQQILLHYGALEETLDIADTQSSLLTPVYGYVQRVTKLLLEVAVSQGLEPRDMTVLDLGCSVGGISFALGDHFKSVLGVDASKANIDIARKIGSQNSFADQNGEHGMAETFQCSQLPSQDAQARVSFQAADPDSLPQDLIGYDVAILTSNLADSHDYFDAVAHRLNGNTAVVKPGGLLFFCEVYPKSCNQRKLPNSYKLLQSADNPVLMKHTESRYEVCFTRMVVWKRTGSDEE